MSRKCVHSLQPKPSRETGQPPEEPPELEDPPDEEGRQVVVVVRPPLEGMSI